MSDSDQRTTIRSVDRAFDILETIRDRGEVRVTELAADLDVAKSTVHNHLNTMADRGFVVAEDGRYRLGLRFLSFPDAVQTSHQLYQAAKAEVDSLVEQTGERSQVLVEENGAGVYIYQQFDDRAITTNSRVGTRVRLHSTAIGKALVAYQPAEVTDRIIEGVEFTSETENTITSEDEYRQELERVRSDGVAFDDEEGIAGMRCVAAPIRDDRDVSVGAISVSGPCTRIHGDRFRESLPEAVKRTAQAIEINYRFS